MDSETILLRIMREHWPSVEALLKKALPPAVFESVRSNVAKALACRTDANGFACFVCEDCAARHRVFFTCKSRCCPTCGKIRAAEGAVKAQSRLLNVQHQHLTFSVPSELRGLLYNDRSLLAVVAKAAATATITAMGTRCKAFAPLPGIMLTVHTYGRDLTFHPHVHVLVTRGGLRADGVWQPIKLYPAAQYRRLWQYYLLKFLRKKLRHQLGPYRMIGSLYNKYPTGFIVNVMSWYRSGKKAAAYLCRYTGRPPLSERRIVAYDGKRVTIAYADYRDGQNKELTLSAARFLLRLLQHAWPRYMRDVHYYGLYQPSRCKAKAQAVAGASKYGDQVLPIRELSRRERLIVALNEKPKTCPACGGRLLFEELVLPRDIHVQKSKTQQARQLCLSM